jgi:hypothetical protein
MKRTLNMKVNMNMKMTYPLLPLQLVVRIVSMSEEAHSTSYTGYTGYTAKYEDNDEYGEGVEYSPSPVKNAYRR